MSYRLDLTAPHDKDVRHIAEGELAEATRMLREQPDGPHAAIHGARKKIKRVRALYRFAAGSDKGFYQSENARLRTIAQSLAVTRDAAALVETAAYLQHSAPEAAVPIDNLLAALTRRRDRIIAEEADLKRTLVSATSELDRAAKALAAARLPKSRKKAAAVMARAWVRTTKAALKACHLCHHSTDEERFHELRKRCQDRWMQSALLGDLWPVPLALLHSQTKKLIDCLGREHDLAVLGERLAELTEDGLPEAAIEPLARLILARRQRLQSQALKQAERLFSADAQAEGRKIRAFLRD